MDKDLVTNSKNICIYELIEMVNKGTICILGKESPDDLEYKQELIDSIIQGLPINAMILLKKNGTYLMLDGNRRVEIIREFINNMFPICWNDDKESIFFKNLPMIEQRKIEDYEVTLYLIDECKEENVETLLKKYRDD